MTIQNKQVVLGNGRRLGAAGLVRCVSGLAAGWRAGDSARRPGARRGATLILIIGALALLSVVILSYFMIGKGDRRQAMAAVRRENIENTVAGFKDHIAIGLIGNDVFSVYVEGENPDTQSALIMREATDYPYSDPQRRTIPVSAGNTPLPPGTAIYDRQRFDPGGNIPKSFTPDPANQNKILRFPGSDPFLASTHPTWLEPTPDAPRMQYIPANKFDSWLENSRDWGQISNIAPDGRYVNLWNLRLNFNAASGFDLNSNGADTDTDPTNNQVSNNLTLMNSDGEAIYALGSQQLDYSGMYGLGTSIADINNPSHWSMRQQAAFRPVGSAGLGFTNPAFPDYQWADTDGDGFYDARWQELVDATDPDNPFSILPKDGRYRWFVAARVVDLSGMLNVNVAADLGLDPGNETDPAYGANNDYRIGLTPSDVDLKTFFTQADFKKIYGLIDLQDGYSQFKQGDPNSYDDYSKYSNEPPLNYVAAAVGSAGYNGIAATIGLILTPVGDQNFTQALPATARGRYDYYTTSGGIFTGEAGFDGSNGTMTGLFGLPDLVELLTYRGVNDPANRSRLEMAAGGRAIDTLYWPQFSPLRDNRSYAIEHDRDSGSFGQATLESLMWSSLDLRQYLTTISGARPLRSSRLAYNTSVFKEILLAGSELNGSQIQRVPVNEEPVDAGLALRTAGLNADVTLRSPAVLFRAYGDALLPCSGDFEAWNPAPDAPSITTAYGYNTETALRTAAAVTANMIDLYDKEDKNNDTFDDGTPSAYTLLLDGSAANRTAIAADKVNFPWWSEGKFLDAANTKWSYSGRLDLDGYRELDNPAFPPALWDGYRLDQAALPNTVTTKAINVYGIEAQPFITEVATFHMYTDAPVPFGVKENVGTEVTIKGANNAGLFADNDFIFNCVAFQLNNPFEETIVLGSKFTGAASDDYNYYFEFGDHKYPIVELNPDGSQSSVSLDPGETKVFYILSYPRSEILSRMTKVYPGVDPAAVDKWIENQLNIEFNNVPAVQIPTVAGNVFPNLIPPLLAGNPGTNLPAGGALNREARLWRVMRSTVDLGLKNSTANDLLADRIRDPDKGAGRPTLDRRLKAGQYQINNTLVQNDDSGYSITFWASIRRPDDPKDSNNGLIPRGALPAWCIERKFGGAGQDSLNLPKKDDADITNLTDLDKSDFSAAPGSSTFAGLISDQANGVYNLVDTLQTLPESKTGNNIDNFIGLGQGQQDGVLYDQLYAEVHLENNQFLRPNDPLVPNSPTHSVLRPADMLLPLGVSPWHDPLASTPDYPVNPNIKGAWVTLGESLAMALGYNNPPNTNGVVSDAKDEPYMDLYGRTDRGSLRLDAFVPFYNVDTDFDPADPRLHKFTPDPADPQAGDELRGTGVPLALGIFDVFTTLDSRFGSLSRATVGVINVNTAPEPVIGAVSMLRPPDDVDYLNALPWFGKVNGGVKHNSQSDIASSIVAYREKTWINPREEDNSVSFVARKANVTGIPGYFNQDPQAGPVQLSGRNAVDGSDAYDQNASAVQIPGLREWPGFASKGELLAVRDLKFASLNGNTLPRPHDMDRLGHDRPANPGQGSSDWKGVDSVFYRDPNQPGLDLDDQIQDDYDAEKLEIANGVMNSLSVRSDIFAATFIVHGYQKADCDDLSNKDPLVPSIARRYLMVVDRSSVVRTGDKPRILVFKELPLK